MDNFFLDYYDLLKSSDSFDNVFILDSTGKKCRFCNKSYPEVLFNNIPHLIPELFGRNNVTSNFECDECNTLFQKYESDTSTMVQHYLTLLNIKTKRGVPVFQSNKQKGERSTILKNKNDERIIDFHTNTDDFKLDEKNGIFTIFFRTRNFRPFSVYKVFLKLGLSLLTEDALQLNNHYLDFLKSEVPLNNGIQNWTVYRYILKTKAYKKPSASLFKAKKTLVGNDLYPEYIIVLYFSNVIFQMFLPLSNKNIEEYNDDITIQPLYYPSYMLEDLKSINGIEVYHFALNEMNKVSINDKIVLQFESKTKNRNWP